MFRGRTSNEQKVRVYNYKDVRGNEPITMNVLMQLRKDIQNDPEYN